MNIKLLMKNVGRTASKYSPEIMIAVGVVGMISATIFAVRETPKALKAIEDEKQRQTNELDAQTRGTVEPVTELDIRDTIRVTWKYYLPVVAVDTISLGCILGATSMNMKRKAALSTVCSLSQAALQEYKGKVVETIGERKAQAITDNIAKDRIDKAPIASSEIYITEKGNTICFDPMSGRYFKSDIDKIKRVVNELNYRMVSGAEEYISLAEFYQAIGIKPTAVSHDVGWNVGRDGLIDISYSSQLAGSDSEMEGTPCLVIDYIVQPRYDYSKLM